MVMAETIEMLQAQMEADARMLNFEQAGRCRDMINLMRGGTSEIEARQADPDGLEPQRPGTMGLGTGRQQVKPPPDGKRPPSATR
jgi:hypothetical protein